jgi:hypothetical protein
LAGKASRKLSHCQHVKIKVNSDYCQRILYQMNRFHFVLLLSNTYQTGKNNECNSLMVLFYVIAFSEKIPGLILIFILLSFSSFVKNSRQVTVILISLSEHTCNQNQHDVQTDLICLKNRKTLDELNQYT